MRVVVGALSLSLLLVQACSGDRTTLLVDLRTDIVPGVEFTRVESVLIVRDGAAGLTLPLNVTRENAFLEGSRIAEFEDLEQTTSLLLVRLFDASGRNLVERRVRVVISGESLGVTVTITRNCVGVMCPQAGDDPQATECLGMRCVTQSCYEERLESCPPPQCMADGDCPRPTASCATGVCRRGTCFAASIGGACTATEYCDPDTGCEPVASPSDGGMGTDAGESDGGAGVDGSVPCVPGPCTVEGDCAVGMIDCTSGVPICVETAMPSGTPCRAATGDCDAEERCTGTAFTCPDDRDAPAGTVCAGGFCDGLGGCGPCSPGAPCGLPSPCELGQIDCSGTPTCVSMGAASSAVTCRAATGTCDVPETCDGIATACPPDVLRPDTFGCRPAVDICDDTEFCTGSLGTCPPDGFLPSSTSCRDAVGPCDIAEQCTGFDAACPTDRFMSGGSACDDTNPCTAPGTCSGPMCRVGMAMKCGPGEICCDAMCIPDTEICVGI